MGAPLIDETRFPEEIARGAVGGAGFATIIVVGSSGGEQRNAQWDQPRYQWDVSHALRDVPQGQELIAFFVARQGKARGFRFKDWSDFATTQDTLYVTGTPTVQMTKTYSSGPVDYARNLYKIVASPAPTFRKNLASFTPADFDVNTGIVLLPILKTKAITNITQAASAVVTVGAAHGFIVGDLVYFIGVNGMTEINGLTAEVTVAGATTVTVDLDTLEFTAYTSGGTLESYAHVDDVWDWTGEFDVPVRFDTDQMKLVQEDVLVRAWEGIPIVEIKNGSLEADLIIPPSELEAE